MVGASWKDIWNRGVSPRGLNILRMVQGAQEAAVTVFKWLVGPLGPGGCGSPGGSESSWDKDKMQSPLAVPGPQHGITHATLATQPGLGGAPTLNPLQQNHLLTSRLDLPFMMMPHPLLPVSLPPASVAMAMNQMNHLNTIANMAAAAQIHSPLSRAGASVIKERIPESPSPVPSLEESHRPGSQTSSHPSSSVSSSPSQMEHHSEKMVMMPKNRKEVIVDQDCRPTIKKFQRDNK
uniref:Dachshund homolog 2-like n=1 Tax=Castor canadensis TaxID=51338 RepID=A0A8B7TJL2_CASCN